MIMNRILAVCALLAVIFTVGKAGSCFRLRQLNGKCQLPMGKRMTRVECCERQGFFTERYYDNWFEVWTRNGGADNCTQACSNSGCERVVCPYNKVCKLRSGRPLCECQVDCSEEERRPVTLCGSNGRTYSSVCQMKIEKCRWNDAFTQLRHYGKCGADRHGCTPRLCPADRVCVLTAAGYASCQIQMILPCPSPMSTQRSLCGDDGVTYPSRCHLRRESQRRGRQIRVAYRRRCSVALTCRDANTLCRNGEKCLRHFKTGQPVCTPCRLWTERCRARMSEQLPVCGVNRVSYSNICAMRLEACSGGMYIGLSQVGSCRLDSNNRRNFFSWLTK